MRYLARVTVQQRTCEKESKDRKYTAKALFTVLGPPPKAIPDHLLTPASISTVSQQSSLLRIDCTLSDPVRLEQVKTSTSRGVNCGKKIVEER